MKKWLILCLFLVMFNFAYADKVKIYEEGNYFYSGGVNTFDGDIVTNKEEADILEEKLLANGYVRLDLIPKKNLNLLLSATQDYWFTKYLVYPYTENMEHIWVYTPTLEDALLQLSTKPYLDDYTYDELTLGTVEISYSAFNSVDEIGTESDAINDKLVSKIEKSAANGYLNEADYITIISPVSGKVVLELLSSHKVYTLYVKAGKPLDLLILEQCYIQSINGVSTIDDKIKTGGYDKANEVDLSDLVDKYDIPSRDYGVVSESFSMTYEEWVSYYNNITVGNKWTKPVWTENGAIVTWEEIKATPDTSDKEEIENTKVPEFITEETQIKDSNENINNNHTKYVVIVVIVISLITAVLLSCIVIKSKRKKEAQ